MAIRTTVTAVLNLFDLSDEEKEAVVDAGSATPFIEAANATVDSVCLESGYDSIRLELIERWLSAHYFSAIIERRGKSEAVSGTVGASVSYEGLTRLGFDYTPYGQHAKILDFAGNLAELEAEQANVKPKFKAGIYHIGEGNRRGEPEAVVEETIE